MDVKPALYSPVVVKPIDNSIVEKVFGNYGYSSDDFPISWGITIKDGYVSWDRFCGNADAMNFVSELARESGCDLADCSSLTMMGIEDLKP